LKKLLKRWKVILKLIEMNKKTISIIIPFFNEISSLGDTVNKLNNVIKYLDIYFFEVLLIDNNSNDGSSLIAKQLSENNNVYKYFKQSRNFGYQSSIRAGYDLCLGDAAIQIDADGQDDPDLIKKFLEKWEEGYDVVFGIRKNRKEFFLINFIRKTFYRIVNKISYINIPVDAGEFRLVDRKIINYLKKFDENNFYLRGLIAFIGFKQYGIEYNRNIRIAGKSKISLFDYFDIAFSAVTSFSKAPLILIFLIGLVVFLISLFLILFYIAMFFSGKISSPGFTTIIVIQLVFFGFFTMLIGFLLLYIIHTLEEVKKRPKYIIEDKE